MVVVAKAPQVGDDVMLPSGRVVRVTVRAVREWPWAAVQTGWLWHVCRKHSRDGHALLSFYFDPVRPAAPLLLDEADAKVLAAALNRARL